MSMAHEDNSVLARDGYMKPASDVFKDRRGGSKSFIPNEPFGYVDPMSSSPRREYDRAPKAGKLHPLVDQIYEGVAHRRDPDDPTERH
jgi:hypothetical protein